MTSEPSEAMESADLATTQDEATAAEQAALDAYECKSCGYQYEPLKGDNRSKIAAGTAFQDLPADWRCPVCGVGKSRFTNVGPVGSPSGFKENLNYGLGVNRMTPGQKNILIFGAMAVAIAFFLSLYGLR